MGAATYLFSLSNLLARCTMATIPSVTFPRRMTVPFNLKLKLELHGCNTGMISRVQRARR